MASGDSNSIKNFFGWLTLWASLPVSLLNYGLTQFLVTLDQDRAYALWMAISLFERLIAIVFGGVLVFGAVLSTPTPATEVHQKIAAAHDESGVAKVKRR